MHKARGIVSVGVSHTSKVAVRDTIAESSGEACANTVYFTRVTNAAAYTANGTASNTVTCHVGALSIIVR